MSLQLDTFNPRVMAVQPSATLAMTARAKQLRREGKPVIGLSAGEPDFDTPAPIAEAAIQAIREGFTHYTENAGMLELREAICRKLAEENGLTYEPDQILCTNGAKQAVAMAIEVLCRPEDEVLIPAPYWVSYPEMVRLAGATPVILPTSVETGYRLTPEQLEAAITERTRLLILCSPSNPTGTVYTPEELEALADVLRRHEHVYVLSDEIYEYILFDAKHVSFASLPGMKERTITVNGFSKGFAMTGWRLGYLAAERPIVKAAAKVQSQFTSAPCSISQKAGLAALQMDKGPIREMVAAFRQRRDFVLERLQAIDGITCPKPEGAFYLFPQVSAFYGRRAPDGRTITDSESLCLYLLEQCHVALVPGQAFGDPNGVRISYAASMENLAEAMRRIEAGLAALR
ncbi:Aspartate transaminase [Rhodothermus marinus SG0.5JP17-172]|jgi:aspartate/methionine/tyrosine aminotransferase|uniref:pyridoxal phosphate-dependent aminotransferase n=1 Tax=Rhodothermus marinus TaxID=29549 RepID=UPI000223D1EA|nr:pyridoxal phosphate-dependent aminotransferase [Rhodothermus marinus]AEN72188.1 Aspartate transaminase [Rhodothermus marinus SG0.5JP17-172]MBO2491023.1 pyridoxal phosphate-dependent aminotransferase [Rhodothermus marinus]